MTPSSSPTHRAAIPFHVMVKPIGPICNLDCKYCFYLEKEKLYPDTRKWAMPDDVLETYVRQYIQQNPAETITFAWQGGEPTLLGVRYFRRVVELQKQYSDGRKIENAFQTNGTLLDDEWAEFFAANNFLIGLSVDGPADLHDVYRVTKQQQPTFPDVMRGLEFLKKHKVEFNTLTVVHRKNAQQPLRVYEFLKEIGSGFMQFIPLIERLPQTRLKVLGMDLAEPPDPDGAGEDEYVPVTEWSVLSRDYGDFLCRIFDQWVQRDVGHVFVQLFDVALGNWMGLGSSLCVFAEKCGNAMAIEHNGDLYSCDHYVYPKYHLGNILNKSLGEMVESDLQRKFGADKATSLPDYCRRCEVKFACQGECPKHRFITTPDGQPGLNYLCAGYKKFFNHINQPMKRMAELLRSGQPAAAIMNDYRPKLNIPAGIKRNDPCPCGSGKKFKACCGH